MSATLEPTVATFAYPEACSVAAAERIVEILDVAIEDRGEAHWATTGGSTPAGIYQHLVSPSLRGELDWRRHVLEDVPGDDEVTGVVGQLNRSVAAAREAGVVRAFRWLDPIHPDVIGAGSQRRLAEQPAMTADVGDSRAARQCLYELERRRARRPDAPGSVLIVIHVLLLTARRRWRRPKSSNSRAAAYPPIR